MAAPVTNAGAFTSPRPAPQYGGGGAGAAPAGGGYQYGAQAQPQPLGGSNLGPGAPGPAAGYGGAAQPGGLTASGYGGGAAGSGGSTLYASPGAYGGSGGGGGGSGGNMYSGPASGYGGFGSPGAGTGYGGAAAPSAVGYGGYGGGPGAGYGGGGYSGGGGGFGGAYGTSIGVQSFGGPAVSHIVPLSDCDVRSVTVFPNHARIRRTVRVQLEASGRHDIVLSGFGKDAERDSFRVTNCPAQILETRFREKKRRAPEPAAAAAAAAADGEPSGFRSELDQLHALRVKFLEAGERLEKEAALVDQFARKYAKPEPAGSGSSADAGFSREALEAFDAFVDLYHRRLEEHDLKRTELRAKVDDVDRRIRALSEANGAATPAGGASGVLREFTVTLGSTSGGVITFDVSYETSKAWWVPSYDVRIDTAPVNPMSSMGGLPQAQQQAQTQVMLFFHGIVKQNTGEDWKDVALVLSTAAAARGALPSIAAGGAAASAHGAGAGPSSHDDLGAAVAAAAAAAASGSAADGGALGGSASGKKKRSGGRRSTPSTRGRGADSDSADSSDSDNDDEVAAVRASMSSAAATEFVVQAPTTLVSGSRERVLVKQPDALASSAVHYIMPRASPTAFLALNLTNNSGTSFVPGPANVYQHNDFVTRTKLAAMAPQQSAELFVGADPSLVTRYSRQSKVVTTKGKTVIEKHVIGLTVLSMAGVGSVAVRCREVLPIGRDPRLKVKPPKFENGIVPAFNIATGLVQWDATLMRSPAPTEFVMSFTVEHPTGVSSAPATPV